MNLRIKSLLLMSASAGFVFSAPSLAQDNGGGIEEIIVTATKRASSIQDVPFSVNAQTQKDILRTGATSLEDIARNVAGLTIQNLGPGQSQVAVRGVSAGQVIRDQPGVKEQVGVYLDETVVSLSLFTPDLDLFDLNRVETLRGPQGTLFGSGSVGGTIRYITNQPNLDVAEGMVEVSGNSLEDGGAGGHIKGMYNFPVSDKLAIRAVGYFTEYGGFIDALGEGGSFKEDVNSGSRTGGRIAVRFEPNENITITPRVVYQEIEADGFNRQDVFNLYANPYTTTRPAIQLGERQQYLLLEEGFKDETLIVDLTIEASFEGFDVTSITSYTDRDILVSRDASALTGSVSVDLGYTAADVLLPSNLLDTTEVEQWTQEVRLSSNSNGPLQWLVGAFYTDVERVYAQRLPTPGYDAATDAALGAGTSAAVANGYGVDSPYNADLPYKLEQFAIFFEGTYDVSDALHVTVGGRWYDYDETRTIDQGGLFSSGFTNIVDDTSSTGFTPRFMVSYDVNEDVTLNAQISQGFRLGGVNDPLNSTLCTPADEAIFGGFQAYEDEKLWNYEAGIKVAKGIFTLNAAAFHTEIEDLQVTLDAGSCSSRVSFNVEEAHTSGVEFEFSAAPSDNLEFSFTGSMIESEFDSTVQDGNGDILAGIEEGSRLASVPELQLSANMTYSRPVTLGGQDALGFVSLSVQQVGTRFTQPSDQVAGAGDFVSGLPFGGATGADVTSVDLELDAYQLINLRAGLEFDTWDVSLFVNNLTDENVNLSFNRERGGRARLAFMTNQPRMIGVTARMRF